jgi:hypothetical protein
MGVCYVRRLCCVLRVVPVCVCPLCPALFAPLGARLSEPFCLSQKRVRSPLPIAASPATHAQRYQHTTDTDARRRAAPLADQCGCSSLVPVRSALCVPCIPRGAEAVALAAFNGMQPTPLHRRRHGHNPAMQALRLDVLLFFLLPLLSLCTPPSGPSPVTLHCAPRPAQQHFREPAQSATALVLTVSVVSVCHCVRALWCCYFSFSLPGAECVRSFDPHRCSAPRLRWRLPSRGTTGGHPLHIHRVAQQWRNSAGILPLCVLDRDNGATSGRAASSTAHTVRAADGRSAFLFDR